MSNAQTYKLGGSDTLQ